MSFGAWKQGTHLRDNWLNPPDAVPKDLAKLTLTNPCNKRPAWLENAHRRLNEAVLVADQEARVTVSYPSARQR
jgi:hypothetical protein